ncbi:expressed unknown protein [Seminavis robusta]|uniref:Uncharacterized protein n=1 Tax=Seminavis robusta TaxID=568900 RepID=A0A9N8EFW0_9STRA|nr:expressed unknown protein [Seminavis robusta]|eukprot:Sro1126_g244130.1 n/a (141) ;mRNA; f:31743-32165
MVVDSHGGGAGTPNDVERQSTSNNEDTVNNEEEQDSVAVSGNTTSRESQNSSVPAPESTVSPEAATETSPASSASTRTSDADRCILRWMKCQSHAIQGMVILLALVFWAFFFELSWYQLAWFIPVVILFAAARMCPSNGI